MSDERVNYGSWLLRLIAWDSLLPACLMLAPLVIETLFPKQRGIMEITAVILPIGAFFLRIRAGKRYIASNRCSQKVRWFQHGALYLGIMPLVLIDCVIILSHLMPKGALLASAGDRIVLGLMFGFYLALMAIAMYPGKDDPLWSDEWNHGPTFPEEGEAPVWPDA